MALEETTQRIRELFDKSCVELFRSLNCEVTRLDEGGDVDDNAPLSYVDAGSDDIEVVIVLRASLPVLTITYPRFDSKNILSVNEEQLEDWLSELGNQLIGRFKNLLLAHGCAIKIGLPELIYDSAGVTLPVRDHEAYRCFFDIDKERIECSLYTHIYNENLTLKEQQPEPGGAAEGELELF